MEINKTSNKSGIGFCGLLTIVFITLKLLGKINWSWVWVLAPIWIPVTFAILLIVICIIVKMIVDRE